MKGNILEERTLKVLTCTGEIRNVQTSAGLPTIQMRPETLNIRISLGSLQAGSEGYRAVSSLYNHLERVLETNSIAKTGSIFQMFTESLSQHY